MGHGVSVVADSMGRKSLVGTRHQPIDAPRSCATDRRRAWSSKRKRERANCLRPRPPIKSLRSTDALLFFVERPGQLLDREALFQALWPGLVVEDNNLSQTLSALRRALGDDAQRARYILTVPRRGFRFVSAVHQVSLEPDNERDAKAPDASEPASANGDAQKALDAARRAEQYPEGSAQAIAKIGSVLAVSGQRDEALTVLQRLLARSREQYVPPSVIAGVHCALGDRTQTLDALEQAYAARDMHLPFLKITPCLRCAARRPAFRSTVASIGLPDTPATTGKL